MTREELIEFAKFLDDCDLLGIEYIKLRVEQWIELNQNYPI